MMHLNKQEFHAWAYDDLLTNTTRGVLAEYIVATALGVHDTRRLEWDKHDLCVGDIGVEVKSAAYVQSWVQSQPSVIIASPMVEGLPVTTESISGGRPAS